MCELVTSSSPCSMAGSASALVETSRCQCTFVTARICAQIGAYTRSSTSCAARHSYLIRFCAYSHDVRGASGPLRSAQRTESQPHLLQAARGIVACAGSRLSTSAVTERLRTRRLRLGCTVRRKGRRHNYVLHQRMERGSGAKLVGIESGVISGLNLASQIRRLAAAVGDNANDDRYSKCSGW